MLAPIIVFAYDRPDHVAETLTSLSKNQLADESILYVFCDGPKESASEEQKLRISSVRRVVRSKKWCKDVNVIESSTNKGLANSIIEGVSYVLEKFGKAIILEDDLVTSPYFLKYMNSALDFYKEKFSVFAIGGYNFPDCTVHIPEDYCWDTYVSLRVCTWGWATWSDRWRKVNWSTQEAEMIFSYPSQMSAFKRAGDDMVDWLRMQISGKVDSWGIRFAYAQFVNHAITIMPCKTFVNNIGFDGSGVNCFHQKIKQGDLSLSASFNFVDTIYEDARIINAFFSSRSYAKRPLWQKCCNRLARLVGKKPPFVIKKKVYYI